MTKGFTVVLLAAGLAGCGATPVEHRNYREIGPGEGMFAETSSWEWRRMGEIQTGSAPAVSNQRTAAEVDDFKKWRESAAGSAERKEFDDWRAWQQWKRRNP